MHLPREKTNIQGADRNIPSAAKLPRRRLVLFMRVVVVVNAS